MKKLITLAAMAVIAFAGVNAQPAQRMVGNLRPAGLNAEKNLAANLSMKSFRTKATTPSHKAVGDSYTVPVTWKGQTQAECAEFTMIDANGDGNGTWNEWTFNEDYLNNAGTYYSLTFITATTDNDDWLITPPVKLMGNKRYYLSYTINVGNRMGNTATYEVKYGSNKTVAAMTNDVNSFTQPKGYTDYTENLIVPAADGEYYFGFHVTTTSSFTDTYVLNISVEEAPEATAPAGVTDFKVIANPQGELKATVDLVAPSVDMEGNPLSATSLTGVKIFRDDTQIADLAATPGQHITYSDEVEEIGWYTYKAIPYGETDGAEESYDVYIGVDLPGYIYTTVLAKTLTGIILKWEAPAGYYGAGPYFADQLRYEIYQVDDQGQTVLVDQVTGQTSWEMEMDLDAAGEAQSRLVYVVAAINAAGYNAGSVYSNALIKGEPYQVNFIEDFTGGSFSHSFNEIIYLSQSSGGSGNSQAGVYFDDTASTVADEVALKIVACSLDSVAYRTGKISLSRATRPRLAFNYKLSGQDFGQAGFEEQFATFNVIVEGESGRRATVMTSKVNTSTEWASCVFDLADFSAERWIRVYFENTAYTKLVAGQAVVYLDNVAVADINDIAGTITANASRRVVRGSSGSALVTIGNHGALPLENYRLSVTLGDSDLSSQASLTPIEAYGGRKSYEFSFDAPITSQVDQAVLNIQLIAEGNVADLEHTTASFNIVFNDPNLEKVSDAAGNYDDDAQLVHVTWKAPSEVINVTESFEDYTSWTASGIGKWTLVNRNGGLGGMWVNDGEYPLHNTDFAWMVYDASNFNGYDVSENPAFAAQDGCKAMVSTYRNDGKQFIDSDNWLISPELPGNSQEISFWINGWKYNGASQRYAVYYSTTDTDPGSGSTSTGSFKAIAPEGSSNAYRFTEGDNTWNEVKVTLPDGAKYFAIRDASLASNAMVIFVDNISFTAVNGKVKAYRIYRNGEFVAETDGLFFDDSVLPEEGKPSLYQITVVYEDGGESGAVSFEVEKSNGVALVTFGENLRFDIYTIDGRLVRHNAASADGLTSGIYVANGRKIVVK